MLIKGYSSRNHGEQEAYKERKRAPIHKKFKFNRDPGKQKKYKTNIRSSMPIKGNFNRDHGELEAFNGPKRAPMHKNANLMESEGRNCI